MELKRERDRERDGGEKSSSDGKKDIEIGGEERERERGRDAGWRDRVERGRGSYVFILRVPT